MQKSTIYIFLTSNHTTLKPKDLWCKPYYLQIRLKFSKLSEPANIQVLVSMIKSSRSYIMNPLFGQE